MSIDRANSLADKLDGLKTNLYNNDFLLTWERTEAELKATLLAAEAREAWLAAPVALD